MTVVVSKVGKRFEDAEFLKCEQTFGERDTYVEFIDDKKTLTAGQYWI